MEKSARKTLWRIALVGLFVSAVLRFFSHPPYQVPYFAWVSLVGWFLFLHVCTSAKQVAAGTAVWSLLFFIPSIFWVTNVTVLGWILLCPVLAGYEVGFALIWNALFSPSDASYLPAGVFGWVSVEILRSKLLGGFPYVYLAHSQADLLSLIQISDITGTWGLSALIFWINGVVFYLVLRRLYASNSGADSVQKIRPGKGLTWMSAGVGVLVLGGVTVYGFVRPHQMETRRGPEIGIVQGNIPPRIKHDQSMSREVYEAYLEGTREVSGADLVVIPETMYPYGVYEANGNIQHARPELWEPFREAADGPLLVGMHTFRNRNGREQHFNSAWLFDSDGTPMDSYYKYHLVPFGETIPGEVILPWLFDFVHSRLDLPDFNAISPGDAPAETGPMVLGEMRIQPLICFEIAFSGEVRQRMKKGANLMINMSNEGWFFDSAELDQMRAIARFRSVENRATMVRATNTGISGFIWPDGSDTILTDTNGEDRLFSGTMVESVKLTDVETIFTAYGFWITILWPVLFSGLVLFRLAGRSPFSGSGSV